MYAPGALRKMPRVSRALNADSSMAGTGRVAPIADTYPMSDREPELTEPTIHPSPGWGFCCAVRYF